MAEDKDRNNDFDYHIRDNPKISPNSLTDFYCPFNAHTRKTVPRSLDPHISRAFLETGMIVRAGLPYGPEVRVVLGFLLVLWCVLTPVGLGHAG